MTTPDPQPDDDFDFAELYNMADHVAAKTAEIDYDGEPAGAGLNGRAPWKRGGPLTPADNDAWFQSKVAERYAAKKADREAERELNEIEAAQRYRPATVLEYPGTLADSLKRERPAQRYLIEGLCGISHNLSVEALYKTGKTVLMCSAAGALADGTPFLGFAQVHRPDGPVAFWNCEMDADDFDDFLTPHVTDTSRVAPAHLRWRPMPLMVSQPARDEAVRWLRWHGATVWFIDSWTRLCAWNGIDPADNFAVPRLTAALDEIKHEAGVTALVVSGHMPHAARTDRAYERGLGAQAFSAWVDAMWRYTRDDSNRRFLAAEGRKVGLEECQVFLDGAGRLTAYQGNRDSVAGVTLGHTLMLIITTSPGISTAQVVKAAGKRKEDTEAVLRDLLSRNLVYTMPGPRNAVLWYQASGQI